MGKKLTISVNDFARYLTHPDREETELVALMNQYLPDDQLSPIGNAMATYLPSDRLPGFMNWTLPSLNLNELIAFFASMKKQAPSWDQW